jgi:predicted ArsR family transcriptional regulator
MRDARALDEALVQLVAAGEGRINALAYRLRLSPQSVGDHLRELVRGGRVRTEPMPGSRRQKRYVGAGEIKEPVA